MESLRDLWQNEFIKWSVTTVIAGLFAYFLRRLETRESVQKDQATTIQILAKELKISVEDLTSALQDAGKWRDEVTNLKKLYGVFMGYFLANVEHMRKHGINPLPPPEELKSDPMIIKFVLRKKAKKR